MKKWLIASLLFTVAPFLILIMSIALIFGIQEEEPAQPSGDSIAFTGEFTPDLPAVPDIKGTGNFSDETAQLAVATAIKYRLLPSVILSQFAYESEWGRSHSATADNNFFGITWFEGCPFPKGTARGIGGSEGGWYMRFPDAKTAFNYYGYMVAKQSNFNACVGNKSPGECLLILGRGGYAAAGITETSPYYTNCLAIIQSNRLSEQYDQVAISRWLELPGLDPIIGNGKIAVLESVLGSKVGSGQCYAMTAYYVRSQGGPELDGSGKIYASQIGSDYDWSSYGWKVIFNPTFEQLKAGDVINWGAGGIAITQYGHTGAIAAVGTNGNFVTYEQNSAGEFVTKHNRSMQSAPITSIVRKVKK